MVNDFGSSNRQSPAFSLHQMPCQLRPSDHEDLEDISRELEKADVEDDIQIAVMRLIDFQKW